MAAAAVRPADLTGKIKAEQAAKHAEELKAREGEIALMNAASAAVKEGVIDLTAPAAPAVEVKTEVTVKDRVKEIRVNTDLENVTIGRDNHYTFEIGQTYRVPGHVYDHLEEKGYVWH